MTTDDLGASGYAPGTLARLYREVAAQVEDDAATSFTGDDVFEAATWLRDALTAKLSAADHIRGRSVADRCARVSGDPRGLRGAVRRTVAAIRRSWRQGPSGLVS